MKKRVVAILMATVVAVGLLAGCIAPDAVADDTEAVRPPGGCVSLLPA